jgi:choline dehydrogenase-like flavoprotein
MGGLRLTPRQSEEGVVMWRTIMAGGSTVVSCGNGVRCLEAELRALGVDLADELDETEKELGIRPLAEDLLSPGSRAMREAALRLGYTFDLMPKFIDTPKCMACAMCVMGCRPDAKWTALRHLDEAIAAGAEVSYRAKVEEVIVEGGRARGVACHGPGAPPRVLADKVILCAGGLGTPPILQRAGIAGAGEGLFVDMFVNVYAVTNGLNLADEPMMSLVDHEFHESEGFILSPFVNRTKIARFTELGARGSLMPTRRMIGMMVKIADEPVGCLHPDGRIAKPVTARDRSRLSRGCSVIEQILLETGIRTDSIVRTRVQGAHPGGTAAIGRVVDSDLRTEIAGLFVCDASVLPEAPGLPPIVTIVALAKRLAKALAA